MSPDEAAEVILDELRKREIETMAMVADEGYYGLSLSPIGVQRFLDAMVPGKLDRDDDLVPRMVGRPADLWVGAEEWHWHASLYLTEDSLVAMGAAGLKLHVSVEIPESDLPEVARRLSGSGRVP
jgi:hypothetical protein